MSFFAGYLLGLEESGSPAVIQPLSVTQNGKYDAPAGVDGFNPVIVNVPDRYDEGYNAGYEQGYSNGKKIYENLYDRETGTLPPITDDMGNVIENAIPITNDDELNDYLKSTAFVSNGDSVNVIGFGGDTEFTVYRSEEYNSHYKQYVVKMNVKIRNRITGKERIFVGPNGLITDYPSTIKTKVNSVYFYNSYGSVGIDYSCTFPDGRDTGGNAGGDARDVGGTKFIENNTSTEWIYS